MNTLKGGVLVGLAMVKADDLCALKVGEMDRPVIGGDKGSCLERRLERSTNIHIFDPLL